MNMRLRTIALVAAILGGLGSSPGHAQPAGPGYGPMLQQMTPEQRLQMWEAMHRWGYGPGTMMGPGMMGHGMMGPGYGALLTPQQYQQWWEHMHQRGHRLRMWQRLTPEQRQQVWEYVERLQPPPGTPAASETPASSDAPPPVEAPPEK